MENLCPPILSIELVKSILPAFFFFLSDTPFLLASTDDVWVGPWCYPETFATTPPDGYGTTNEILRVELFIGVWEWAIPVAWLIICNREIFSEGITNWAYGFIPIVEV